MEAAAPLGRVGVVERARLVGVVQRGGVVRPRFQAPVGVAAVAPSQAHLGDLLDDVERFVWSFPEVEVVDAERSWVDA